MSIEKIQILKTLCYDQFKCIANKCNYSCCKNWSIYIDTLHYNHYLNCGIKNLVTKTRKHNEELWQMVLTEDGSCPFLSQTGLCDLIIQYGDDILCQTCQTFPRNKKRFNYTYEYSLSNACPAVISLLQQTTPPLSFELVGTEDDYDDNNNAKEYLIQCRNMIIDLLQITDIPLWVRLYFCYSAAYKIRYEHDIDKTLSQYNSSDYLLTVYNELINTDLNINSKLHIIYEMLSTVYNRNSLDIHEQKYYELFKYIGTIDTDELQSEWIEFQNIYEQHETLFENVVVNHAFGNIKCVNKKQFHYSVFRMIEEMSLIKFTMFMYWLQIGKKNISEEIPYIICYFARKFEHEEVQNMLSYVKSFESLHWLEHGYIFMLIR